jgi:isocitrate/isopropylmalate dehydrogenase
MLLEWRGRRESDDGLVEAGDLIATALDAVLDDPTTRTRDLRGNSSTSQFTDAVCERITNIHH